MKKLKIFSLLSTLFFIAACGKTTGLAPDASGSSGCTTCKIFVTATAYNGNLGGIPGADAKCTTDANLPTGGETYKAMLVDGLVRQACNSPNCFMGSSGNRDWVLKGNTTYTRPDRTVIGKTQSGGVLNFPLTNAIDSLSQYAWTGMKPDWTNAGDSYACTSWSSSLHSASGQVWHSDATSDLSLDYGSPACDNTYRIICVEQ